MTIARRLILLLAVPIVVLIGLGGIEIYQLRRIQHQSTFVAGLQVESLQALGLISEKVTEMRVGLRTCLLVEGAEAKSDVAKTIRQKSAELNQLLNEYGDTLVSDDKDRRLYTEFRTLNRDWALDAESVTSLAISGRSEEARSKLLVGHTPEVGARMGSVLTEWIAHNEHLAREGNNGTAAAIGGVEWKTAGTVAAALLFSGILGYVTFRSIVHPIRGLQSSVKQIADGDYLQPVPYTDAAGETGDLARSIAVLKRGAAETAEQRWVKAAMAKLSATLQRAATVSEFGDGLFAGLMPLLGGGVAALYTLDKDKESVHRAASYGLDGAKPPEAFREGEGLVGECIRSRKATRVHGAPPEYLRITSALGGAAPVNVIAHPLIAQAQVLGAIEIATFRAFTASEQALLDELLPDVTMSLQVLLRNVATQELLSQTQEQAQQLEQQAAIIRLRGNLDAMHSEIGEALVRPQDFNVTMQSCAEAVMRGASGAFTRIWMLEPGTDILALCTSVGLHTNLDGEHSRVKVGERKLGRIAASRRPLETNAIQDESGVDVEWARQNGIVSFAGYPLLVQDRLVGVIVTFARHPLAEVELRALAEAARRIGLGIQRRQTEEELQRINFQADSALELTKAGYWHVPLDGSGWYNSSERAVRIFGDLPAPGHRYTLAHWAEQVRLGDEDAARATAENFAAAAEGKIPVYDVIYAYKRPVDGRVVWIHALGRVMKDQDGKATDMFGVTQDITEFKQLETQLVSAREKAEEATAAKSMFLANMSHEIRTPMNAIIGMTHLALKTDLTPKQRDYLVKVRSAAGTLLGIINDILDFSKIEAGKLDIESAEFRFCDVLENLSTVVSQKAQEKNLEFLISAQSDIPPNLIGDPLRLGQVLINLVNNAVKFTERGEVIIGAEIESRTPDRVTLKFACHDTGIGMTPEQVSRLFQAFSQADTSTTRKFGGTGLGLSISKRLVEMMGGRIWVESEAGAGSTFFFTASFGVGAAEEHQTRFIPDIGGIRALVVDDNAQAREILCDALRGFSLRADAVASGPDAIQALSAADSVDRYQLVLMDWKMPGMDGLQASAIIRRDTGLKHMPRIVMVTAFGRDEIRSQAEQIGIDAFLTKPVNASVLYDTLMEQFGGRLEASGAKHRKDTAGEYDATGVRILLVEDNEMNQQVATELLESAGAVVTVAGHGGIAVGLLRDGPQPPPFDAVLMDLQMPEMDGITATRLLRADGRFKDLPILAMTAHALVEERERCLAAGMNDHITKPIDPDALFATLARWTAPRKAAAVAATAASAAPAQVGEVVPEIDGIDVAGGLKRVAGNRRLYRSLMEQFAAKQADADSRIGEALAAGDRELAERLAHTLKGVAGNLGIGGIQSAAANLEKAIRQGNAGVEVPLLELRAALGPQVSAIRKALGTIAEEAPKPAAVFDADAANRAVARLMSLIDANDGDAADASDDVAAALSGRVDPTLLNALRDTVGEFDFEGARAKLSQIAAECHLSLG